MSSTNIVSIMNPQPGDVFRKSYQPWYNGLISLINHIVFKLFKTENSMWRQMATYLRDSLNSETSRTNLQDRIQRDRIQRIVTASSSREISRITRDILATELQEPNDFAGLKRLSTPPNRLRFSAITGFLNTLQNVPIVSGCFQPENSLPFESVKRQIDEAINQNDAAQKILIPIAVGKPTLGELGKHIVLLVLDPQNEEIWFLDSKGSDYRHPANKIYDSAEGSYTIRDVVDYCHTKMRNPQEITIKMLSTACQEDTSQCGVFVSYFADQIAQGQTIEQIGQNLPTSRKMVPFRAEMMSRIVAHVCNKEEPITQEPIQKPVADEPEYDLGE
ncbi:MAG: hypothetical protein JW769_01630 [Parachlamydiales bacterium]|nr:hypothetical protein [Parachlamydiales bacterium]